jgi:hypothetical protein
MLMFFLGVFVSYSLCLTVYIGWENYKLYLNKK